MSLHINVENKTSETQKKFGVIHLNVPNLFKFYEKIPFGVKIMQKSAKTTQLSNKCNKYEFLHF